MFAIIYYVRDIRSVHLVLVNAAAKMKTTR